ncbi:MAG: DUF5615 family PIN-like protein, partial [Gammaproteobacteria bacterium]
MIRLLLDQGLPRSTCAALPQSDWDVLHVGDIGMSRATDRAILEFAANDDRVIVTLDADFHTYLALSGATGPSVVRIRIEGLQGAALAELLTKAWPKFEHAIDGGAMITITRNTLRIRTLPV